MAFPYPGFHGAAREDVMLFLENLEMASISNHIVDPAQLLRLLQMFLKGDTRTWFIKLEARIAAAQPPQVLLMGDV